MVTKENKIILAQPRGFCAGVRRAVDIVEIAITQYANQHAICVLHEIVHNRYVVDYFTEKGVKFVDHVRDVPDGALLIFSAHGVSREIENEAKSRNLHIINATCPLVTKVHLEAQRYETNDLQIILIGHADHPEVKGTSGQVKQKVMLLQSKEEIDHLQVDNPEKLAYVTQTTLSVDDTREIITALKKRFPNILGPELRDICYATQNRQNAVQKLASLVDVVLVIGSSNSSNSNRLRDICTVQGVPAYLINSYRDVNFNWLTGASTIGVTAGASAPDILVEELVEYLSEKLEAQVCDLEGVTEKVMFNLPKELSVDSTTKRPLAW